MRNVDHAFLPVNIEEKQLNTEIIDVNDNRRGEKAVTFYTIRHGIYWAMCDRNTLQCTHGHGRFTYNK